MSENAQVQELARFAREQQFNAQYRQYFGDVWDEAGVKDISKMTISDAEKTLKVLADSQASPQFVKSLLAQAAIDGAPLQVLEYFLSSDIDGDGRTLAQEIWKDGTNPLEPDSPQPGSNAKMLDHRFLGQGEQGENWGQGEKTEQGEQGENWPDMDWEI